MDPALPCLARWPNLPPPPLSSNWTPMLPILPLHLNYFCTSHRRPVRDIPRSDAWTSAVRSGACTRGSSSVLLPFRLRSQLSPADTSSPPPRLHRRTTTRSNHLGLLQEGKQTSLCFHFPVLIKPDSSRICNTRRCWKLSARRVFMRCTGYGFFSPHLSFFFSPSPGHRKPWCPITDVY